MLEVITLGLATPIAKIILDKLYEGMVQPIAQEIHQVIVQFDDVNAKNVQQIFGGQGLQVNDPKSQVIQAGDDNKFYFGVKPED
ncbi:hypothetical protein AB3R30_18290 [Leptolyngbyaceae cyanobacterium UHCC 1019]